MRTQSGVVQTCCTDDRHERPEGRDLSHERALRAYTHSNSNYGLLGTRSRWRVHTAWDQIMLMHRGCSRGVGHSMPVVMPGAIWDRQLCVNGFCGAGSSCVGNAWLCTTPMAMSWSAMGSICSAFQLCRDCMHQHMASASLGISGI